MAAKTDGSGARRAVEAGEGRSARGARKDPQIINFGLIFVAALALLVSLWVRAGLNGRVDEMAREVSDLPDKLQPIMKEQAAAAIDPQIKALTDRIDTLEMSLKNLRKDVSANWRAVEKSLEKDR